MNKIIAIWTAFAIFIPCIAGIPGKAAESLRLENRSFIWLEAENADHMQGGNGPVSDSAASGGEYVKCDTRTAGAVLCLDFSLDLLEAGGYDIWILGTPSNLTYLSRHNVELNGRRETVTDGPLDSSVLYKTYLSGSEIDVCWTKAVPGAALEAGLNTIRYTLEERDGGDGTFGVLDCIVAVPSDWGWAPYKLRQPYNGNDVQISLGSGALGAETITRKGTLKVKVNLSVLEKQTADPTFYAALLWKGEIVSSAVYEPWLPVSSWQPGTLYNGTITLPIPFCAPDGAYDVVCGVGTKDTDICFADGQKQKRVGGVFCGEPVQRPAIAEFSDMQAVWAEESLHVAGTITATSALESGILFVKLWRGKELWGVCESGPAVCLPENTEAQIDVDVRLPAGIPGGRYRLEAGVYGLNGTADMGKITVAAAGSYGYKPLSNGVYRAKTGKEHFWYVNQQNALIWDGEPYIPMGGMECLMSVTYYTNALPALEKLWAEDYAELLVLAGQGIRDLYINPVSFADIPPKWYWQFVLDTLDALGFRYGLQYGMSKDGVREGTLYYVNAAGANRVTVSGVTAPGKVTASAEKSRFTGFYVDAEAVECRYIVTDSRHHAVETGAGTLTAERDKYVFSAEVKTGLDSSYTVTFAPYVEATYNVIANVWDKRDALVAEAADFAGKVSPGDGFRTIIDPVSNESGFYNAMESARPYSKITNSMYAQWLRDKYKTVEKLCAAWNTADIQGFDTAARLIPLYTTPNTGNYRVYCTDCESEKIYTAGGRAGVMWYDFLAFRDQSVAEAYNDISDAFKTGVDVPIIVKNVWGTKEYFTNTNTSGGLDGIGAECYGGYQALKDLMASNYSVCRAFGKTAWLVVTETSTDENVQTTDDVAGGYDTEEYMNGHFDTLYACGAKGIYDFLLSARHDGRTQTGYSYIANPEMFAWTKNYRERLDSDAAAQYVPKEEKLYVLPYRSNYYTVPNRYTAVYHDDAYQALDFSVVSGGTWIMPVGDAGLDVGVMLANFADGPASCQYGKPFGAMLTDLPAEKKAVYLGFRKDIGTVPELDKYFKEEYGLDPEGSRVQLLSPTPTSRVLTETADGGVWALRDGNLWIIAAEQFTAEAIRAYMDRFGIFTAQTGVEVQNAILKNAGGNLYGFTALIDNYTAQSIPLTMLLAEYDAEGRLCSLVNARKNVSAGQHRVSAEIRASGMRGEIRGFLWGGPDGVTPLYPVCSAAVTE